MFRALLFIIVFLFIALTTAYSLQDASSATGRDIYRQHCASCHGTDRSGSGDVFPSLQNLEDRLSETEVSHLIDNGKGQMPSFSYLSDQEKDALIAFLFGPSQKMVALSAELSGARMFRSNCASCHRATVNDPRPPKARMMEPAPLAGAAERFTRDEFFNILERGICYMPSFNHFTSQEKEALYSYIQSLEAEGTTSRRSMRKRCPMMRMKK